MGVDFLPDIFVKCFMVNYQIFNAFFLFYQPFIKGPDSLVELIDFLTPFILSLNVLLLVLRLKIAELIAQRL